MSSDILKNNEAVEKNIQSSLKKLEQDVLKNQKLIENLKIFIKEKPEKFQWIARKIKTLIASSEAASFDAYLKKNWSNDNMGLWIAVLQTMLHAKPVDGSMWTETITLLKSFIASNFGSIWYSDVSKIHPHELFDKLKHQFEQSISWAEHHFWINSEDELINFAITYQTKDSFQLYLSVQNAVKKIDPSSKIGIDWFGGLGTTKHMKECLLKNNIVVPSNKLNDEIYLISQIFKLYQTKFKTKAPYLITSVQSVGSDWFSRDEWLALWNDNTKIAMKRGLIVSRLLNKDWSYRWEVDQLLLQDNPKKSLVNLLSKINNDPNPATVSVVWRKLDPILKNDGLLNKITQWIISIQKLSLKQSEKTLLLLTLLCENWIAWDVSWSDEKDSVAASDFINKHFWDMSVFKIMATWMVWKLLATSINNPLLNLAPDKVYKPTEISIWIFQIQFLQAAIAIQKFEKPAQDPTRSQVQARLNSPTWSAKIASYVMMMKSDQFHKNKEIYQNA